MSDSSVLETIASSVVRVALKVLAPLWMNGKLESNSVACLEYVKQHAQQGDAASVVATIDEFAASNIMMNVGPDKGAVVDAEIREKKPRVMAEIGAYTGYSTVRFANAQREAAKAAGYEAHYYSFEYSPESAARVREMVAFAGLSDQVTVIEGAFSDQLHVLKDKTVDIYFIDHDKSLYVSDTQKILASGTLATGSLLIADNVLFPGTPEYLAYVDESPQLTSTLHKSPMESTGLINDAISVAIYTA